MSSSLNWMPPAKKIGRRHTNERKTDTRLCGIGLDIPCDPYWGWLSWFSRTLSHFVSFKNRNHWAQFERCLISSSDHDAICIKFDFVESEKVSTREHTRFGQLRETYIRQLVWKCPLCNDYHCGKWRWQHEFKFWSNLITFRIALMILQKIMNPIVLSPALGKIDWLSSLYLFR